MEPIVVENAGSGAEYERWIERNPNGYDLSVEKKPRDVYLMLHRASCHAISPDTKNRSGDCYTEGAL